MPLGGCFFRLKRIHQGLPADVSRKTHGPPPEKQLRQNRMQWYVVSGDCVFCVFH